MNNVQVVKNANYSTILFGAGLAYRLNDKWSCTAGTGWSPVNAKANQPATIFVTAGLVYNVRKLSETTVARNKNSGFIFPANLIQIGYTSNVLGYGVNNFFSNTVFPIFWGGDVEVARGISIYYQRNVFHGRKVFSLDWGASLSWWKGKTSATRDGDI